MDPLIRVRLEVDQSQGAPSGGPSGQGAGGGAQGGTGRRPSPSTRRQDEDQIERTETLRQARMKRRGRQNTLREREAFVERPSRSIREHRQKWKDAVAQEKYVNGPWRPGEKAKRHMRLADAHKRYLDARAVDRARRGIVAARGAETARKAAQSANRANRVGTVVRAGQTAAAVGRGGITGAARMAGGAAFRVAGPAAAAYFGARTVANMAPGVSAFFGGAESAIRGPAREFASLEAGIMGTFEGVEKAKELRSAGLLLGGDLGGDAYALPYRSELSYVATKRGEWAGFIEREQSIRRNAAAGDLFREALFGERSLIAEITGQRRRR